MTLVVADTSAWARLEQRSVARSLGEAIQANVLAITVPITLELLRSARDARELQTLSRRYEALHEIGLTRDIGSRAKDVQALLAARGYHRGPSPTDLLTAAAAEAVGAELWHCDRHFELIAAVTGQPERRLGR